jgi:hypothetical protein
MDNPADIIRTKKKGFRMVTSARKVATVDDSDSQAVAKSFSLEDLKAKFLPHDAIDKSAVGNAKTDSRSDDDLEMVEVEPDTDTGADPDGPGRKAVVISRKSGEIVGEQG